MKLDHQGLAVADAHARHGPQKTDRWDAAPRWPPCGSPAGGRSLSRYTCSSPLCSKSNRTAPLFAIQLKADEIVSAPRRPGSGGCPGPCFSNRSRAINSSSIHGLETGGVPRRRPLGIHRPQVSGYLCDFPAKYRGDVQQMGADIPSTPETGRRLRCSARRREPGGLRRCPVNSSL